MTSRRTLVRSGALAWWLPLALLMSGGARQAQAQYVEPTVFERTGYFALPRLRESSGVAVSRQHRGVLWTHNDSGDEPVLYATDLAGNDLGAYRLAGARAIDWEDIALGPCPGEDGFCLYIADTGDNSAQRPYAVIYIVREPSTLPQRRSPLESIPARPLRVHYPDGPHNVEALTVTPQGEIMLVAKGLFGPIRTYHVTRAEALADSVRPRADSLILETERPFHRSVTGAAISPDGVRLVLRTYTLLLFFARDAHGNFRPAGPPCYLYAREPQGEAVDFLDADTLVLTSEAALGRPAMISRVRCPAAEEGSGSDESRGQITRRAPTLR